MKQLSVRLLNIDEIKSAYENSLVFDFPVDEQKPLDLILRLREEGEYYCYGLFLKNTLKGYAFFCAGKDTKAMLLDYFCVLRTERSSGYGSKFIKLLTTIITGFDGLILEAEDDDYPLDDEDLRIRQRRFAFYFANGVKMTTLRSSVKKVKYKVMFLPIVKMWQDEDVYYALEGIYQTLYGGDLHEEMIDYIKYAE